MDCSTLQQRLGPHPRLTPGPSPRVARRALDDREASQVPGIRSGKALTEPEPFALNPSVAWSIAPDVAIGSGKRPPEPARHSVADARVPALLACC